MDGWTDRQMDGWMDGRTDGWMDGPTDGWMDGWMDESMDDTWYIYVSLFRMSLKWNDGLWWFYSNWFPSLSGFKPPFTKSEQARHIINAVNPRTVPSGVCFFIPPTFPSGTVWYSHWAGSRDRLQEATPICHGRKNHIFPVGFPLNQSNEIINLPLNRNFCMVFHRFPSFSYGFPRSIEWKKTGCRTSGPTLGIWGPSEPSFPKPSRRTHLTGNPWRSFFQCLRQHVLLALMWSNMVKEDAESKGLDTPLTLNKHWGFVFFFFRGNLFLCVRSYVLQNQTKSKKTGQNATSRVAKSCHLTEKKGSQTWGLDHKVGGRMDYQNW